jgi:hypothetical protein
MTIVQDTVGDEILLDLSRAWIELAEARTRQAERDSSANRAAVAECHAGIDSLLDMLLESTSRSEGTHSHPCS